MDIEQVKKWVANLERLGQADMPTEIAGIILTPYELLEHAENNDRVWMSIRDKDLM